MLPEQDRAPQDREQRLEELHPADPLIADDPAAHVVHIRSLTKAAAPGLRVAALIARGPAVERLRVARSVDDVYVSGPLQEAALELLASPAWRRHLRTLAAALRGAERGGVVVLPAEPSRPHLRLTFAAAPPERLDEGAHRLSQVSRLRG